MTDVYSDAEKTYSGPLPVSDSYSETLEVTLPAELSGSHYLLVSSDTEDTVFEHGAEDNNSASSPIEIELAPYADLVTTDVEAPELLVGDPAEITVSWSVANRGTGTGFTHTWLDRVIASEDATLGNGDDLTLAEFSHAGPLEVHQAYDRTETFLLPPGFASRFHLFVQADAEDEVFENVREENNAGEADHLVVAVPRSYADLVVDAVDAPATAGSGDSIEVTWHVDNQGIGATDTSSWTDEILLARDAAGTDAVTTLGRVDHIGSLEAGGSYDRSAQVRLPHDVTESVYVLVTAGARGGPFEFGHDENNTAASQAIEVSLTPPPDLKVADTQLPEEVVSGQRIDVTWTVANEGSGRAAGPWTDRLLLEQVGGTETMAIGSFQFREGLDAGKSYTRTEQFRLPENAQGQFQLVVETDDNKTLYEHGHEDNNRIDAETILIQLSTRPDLQVQSITAPEQADAGGVITAEFVVINQGSAATPARWNDALYLSLDDEISGDDIKVGSLRNAAALRPGEQYVQTVEDIRIPQRLRNNAFLIAETVSDGDVNEFPNEDNNALAVSLDIQPLPPADLVTSDVVAPDQAFAGSEIEVQYTVTNLGTGETFTRSGEDRWNDTVWLAPSRRKPDARRTSDRQNLPGVDDPIRAGRLAVVSHSGLLEVDDGYERTVTVRLPDDVSGQLFITPWADTFNNVVEETRDVNINPDEPNEPHNNNYKARPITVLPPPPLPPSDLTVTSVVADESARGGDPLTVSWTVKNVGPGSTQDDVWRDRVYLQRADAKPRLLGVIDAGAEQLKSGESYTVTHTFDLSPAAQGDQIVVRTEPVDSEGEFTQNNANSVPIEVAPLVSDLQVRSVTVPEDNLSGEPMIVEWTVKNTGDSVWEGTRFWTDAIWLSPDPSFDTGRAQRLDTVPVSTPEALAAGVTYSQTAEVTLPRGIDGTFYLYVQTNLDGQPERRFRRNERDRSFFETHVLEPTGNNLHQVSVPVTYYEPDLQVSDVQVPEMPPQSGETIDVSWTVRNAGNRATRESRWIDRVYLSNDPSLDFGDQFLGSVRRDAVLAAGEEYSVSTDVTLPHGIDGDFHVLVFADSDVAGPPPPKEPRLRLEDDFAQRGRTPIFPTGSKRSSWWHWPPTLSPGATCT